MYESFLKKRQRSYKILRILGPIFLVGSFGLLLSLWFLFPEFINPPQVHQAIKNETLSSSQLTKLAALAPICALLTLLLLFLGSLSLVALNDLEKKYLNIIKDLQKNIAQFSYLRYFN